MFCLPVTNLKHVRRDAKTVAVPLYIAHRAAYRGSITSLENLVKEVAGQAIHYMNIMFGLPEATELNILPLLP